MPSGCQRAGPGDPVLSPPPPALTLNPMPPFLQHRQASMRAMTVKSPEKDTATTDREDDQENSLSGAPSAKGERSDEQLCVPVPGARRGQLDPIPGSALPPTCCGLSLSTLTVDPRPGTWRHSRQAQGRWTLGAATAAQACHLQQAHGHRTGLARGHRAGRAPIPEGSWTTPRELRLSGLQEPPPTPAPLERALGLSHCLSFGVALVEAVRPRGCRRGTQAPLSGRD